MQRQKARQLNLIEVILEKPAPYLLALVILLMTTSTAYGLEPSGVSATRLFRLGRGINIPHWFWLTGMVGEAPNTDFITEQDINFLGQCGIQHVRIPVEVALYADWQNPGVLRSDYLLALDSAIQTLLNANIGVIISPFGDFSSRLSDPAFVPDAAQFLQAFAAHLSKFDPNMVFLQVANEPVLPAPDWAGVQGTLLQAMRLGAPQHTLVTATTLRYGAGDGEWGSLEALSQLTPYQDPNIIYNIHFYEPMVFTFQGAPWSDPWVSYLHDIPYPSSPEGVEPLLPEVTSVAQQTGIDWLADYVRGYGEQQWNSNTLAQRIQIAVNWASQYQVPLLFDEFGVDEEHGAQPEDRARWIQDVRTILETNQSGWTMWDYSGGFRLAEGLPGNRSIDMTTANALGLTCGASA